MILQILLTFLYKKQKNFLKLYNYSKPAIQLTINSYSYGFIIRLNPDLKPESQKKKKTAASGLWENR